MAGDEERGGERREALRERARILVEYDLPDDCVFDYAADVSVGGMFVGTRSPLPVGTRFRLRFRLPGRRRPLEALAEVRWIRPDDGFTRHPGMGLCFVEMDEEDRRALARAIERSEFDD